MMTTVVSESLYVMALMIICTIINIIAIMSVRSKIKDSEHEKQLLNENMNQLRNNINSEIQASRQETLAYIQSSFKAMGDMIASNQRESAENQDMRLMQLNRQFSDLYLMNEQKFDNMRKSVDEKMTLLREENNKQLDQMRATVDEKLQKTLEDRIGQSFKLVSDRLEQVYKGLGEMQTLAAGVGDLKKVLSNVKTRGILGEIQLGSILQQILSPEQYEENVKTKSTGTERVEFAVKLPGEDDKVVYLPIDAKFPGDAYNQLMEAYDTCNPKLIDEASKNLERAIKKAAKDIHEKYVEPPATTDFAIMFLPFEGLYAEVVRRGMVEVLQREYKINIAGPTTMAALLNSLQMGFKTLAIQKHTSEVWDVLGAVKTEFDKFENVLAATQQRINQANAELDKLVGTRTRSIQRKLRNVTSLSDVESAAILELENKDLEI